MGNKETTINGIITFIGSRLKTVLVDFGFAKDEIEAAVAHGVHDIYDSYLMVQSLHNFREKQHDEFIKALAIHTRVKKILLSQKPNLISARLSHEIGNGADRRFPDVQERLLVNDEEKDLLKKINEVRGNIDIAKRYDDQFVFLASLEKIYLLLFRSCEGD